jgi:4-amino-4-deoxy-L-arabinose transferase-like glycosyltransferase
MLFALRFARLPKGQHDLTRYLLFGQSIADGHGYRSVGLHETAYYPPGYPYFVGAVQWVCDHLGLSGHVPLVMGLVQSVLGAVTIGATIALGRRVGGLTVGLVAGWIVALWPNLIIGSSVLLSETLFLSVFTLTMVVFADLVRAAAAPTVAPRSAIIRGVLLAGVLSGLTVLIRPQAVLVAPVILLAMLLSVRSWRRALAIAGGALGVLAIVALVMTPWVIRNQRVFGQTVLVSTNGGDNLCVGFHPGATGHFEIPQYCNTGEFYVDGPAAELRRDRETAARAKEWISKNPTALPTLSLRKLWFTYNHDYDAIRALESFENDLFLTSWQRSALYDASDYYSFAVGAGVLCGLVLLLVRVVRSAARGGLDLMIAGSTVAGGLVVVLFFGDPRFKVPTTSCFAVVASVAIVAAWRWGAERIVSRSRPDSGQ